MITAPLTENEQTRADVVFKILQELETGNAPADWIEQLRVTDVGTYGEQWEFSRRLGAHGCQIYWHGKSVTVLGTPYNLQKREGLKNLPPKDKTFQRPFNKKNVMQSNPFIIDCLETAAKVAYVQGLEKAMKVCIEAMSNQPAEPAPDGGWYYGPFLAE